MTPSLSMRAAWQQVAAEAEAITTLHYCYDRGVRWACGGCEQDHPCDSFTAADRIRVTALAQINALNEAEREVAGRTTRHYTDRVLILDPETT